MDDQGLYAALVERGMTRRSFLKFASAMTAALALPASYAPRIASAVEAAPRLPVIWIRAQTCGGNTESLLRSPDPTIETLLLDTISLEYHQSLLATAGPGLDLARTTAMERYPDGYVAVVEGAVPEGEGGAYCLVGGRPVGDIVQETAAGALAVIAVGSCATDGGAPAASGGLTDAKGIRGLVGDTKLIVLPGCPMNVINLTAVIVHYLTFREWPPLDLVGRPLAAYGNLIHNQCERRPHFEFGEFVLAWGDEGAQRGWCLYKMGCKGPEAMGNCPTVRYGNGVSWNIRAGAGCIGCVTTDSWDQMGPAYRRLPSPVPFFPNLTADMVGAAVLGGVAAVAGVHAVGMGVRFKRRARNERRAALATAEGMAVAGAADEAAEAGVRAAEDVAGTADAGAADGGAADAGAADAGAADAGAPPAGDGSEAPAAPEER